MQKYQGLLKRLWGKRTISNIFASCTKSQEGTLQASQTQMNTMSWHHHWLFSRWHHKIDVVKQWFIRVACIALWWFFYTLLNRGHHNYYNSVLSYQMALQATKMNAMQWHHHLFIWWYHKADDIIKLIFCLSDLLALPSCGNLYPNDLS